jgi:hypothetical protein
MKRALTVKNLLDKKYNTFPFEGIWKDIFGTPTTNGIWSIYGKDKNGKTSGTLIIANLLSSYTKVLYVSAEEGTDAEFQNAVIRTQISHNSKQLHFTEYETIEELYIRLKRRKCPKVVVLDNMTIYNAELKGVGIQNLAKDFPTHLFICLSHEERNMPYTAAGKMANKLAKIIIRVQGLKLIVSGRCPGGSLMINEEKAMLYHGT